MGGAIAKELGKRLLVFVVGSLIVEGACRAAKNKLNGKTVFGNEKKPKEETYVDWRGNVVLGTADGKVV